MYEVGFPDNVDPGSQQYPQGLSADEVAQREQEEEEVVWLDDQCPWLDPNWGMQGCGDQVEMWWGMLGIDVPNVNAEHQLMSTILR